MQLEFPWRDEWSLLHELEERTGLALCLTVTDNASALMTYRPGGAGRAGRLRLHHMFLTADPRVIDALAQWVVRRRCRRADTVLGAFIREHHHLVRDRVPGNHRLHTKGSHCDLRAIFERLNAEYFGGSVTAAITWGRTPTQRRRRSIRFGSFSAREGLIRIHPFLDQEPVPEYFVRYIVFHEMLHAYLGVGETPGCRRRIHSREFKQRERAYPEYPQAVAWQDNEANLAKLLSPTRRRQ